MKIIDYKINNEVFIDLIPSEEEFEALQEGFVISENLSIGKQIFNIGVKYNQGQLNAFKKMQLQETTA